MRTHLFLRSLLALFSVMASLWLIALMPSGSAFAAVQGTPPFDMWQGMILMSSLSMALFMARLLTRS